MPNWTTHDETPRPGRPRNGLIERWRSQVWIHTIQSRTGRNRGYALEKFLEPDKVVYDAREGITRRPCKYDKYLRGEIGPSEETLALVEAKLPGTRRVFDHPFWSIIHRPQDSLEDLYDDLARLRPKIASLLFMRTLKGQRRPSRSEPSAGAMTYLRRHSDWDALAAAIGLMQEAECLGRDFYRELLAKSTTTIFLRCFIGSSFWNIRHGVFSYLRQNFFYIGDPASTDSWAGDWNQYLDKLDLDMALEFRSVILMTIDKLHLLKYCYPAPLSCLEIAENYFNRSLTLAAWDPDFNSNLAEIRSMPEIRNLKRALRRWEKRHTSGFDIRNRRSH